MSKKKISVTLDWAEWHEVDYALVMLQAVEEISIGDSQVACKSAIRKRISDQVKKEEDG